MHRIVFLLVLLLAANSHAKKPRDSFAAFVNEAVPVYVSKKSPLIAYHIVGNEIILPSASKSDEHVVKWEGVPIRSSFAECDERMRIIYRGHKGQWKLGWIDCSADITQFPYYTPPQGKMMSPAILLAAKNSFLLKELIN